MGTGKDRSLRSLWGVAALLVLSALAFAAHRWIGSESLRAGVEGSWALLQTAPPLVFFVSMALICLLPVPISLFYVSAGPLYGIVPALLWIVPAIALNQVLAHGLCNGVLRPSIERMIESRGYTVPRVTKKGDQTLFTTVVRITPGFPYFLQNLVLGIAGVERTRYLLISVPIQMLYATGFVVLGRSAFEGRAGVAIGALALLVAASAIARVVHGRLRRRVGAGEETDPAGPVTPG